MAKTTSGVNKTQAIKDYLTAHPHEGPKAVAEALTAKGLDVTAGYVSTIKSNMKMKGSEPGKRSASFARSPASGDSVSLDSLIKAKKLVEELGGVDDARRILDALARLRV